MISAIREHASTTVSRPPPSRYVSNTKRQHHTVRRTTTEAVLNSPYIESDAPSHEILIDAQRQIVEKYPLARKPTSRSDPLTWELISNHFPTDDKDSLFWWRTTGIPLAVLLEKAGYSVQSQCQHLLFFYYCVVPELGVGSDAQGLPQAWRSFMTDHFTPIELSWEWGREGDNPTVRFSFEPIGRLAGTPSDTLNRYAATQVMHRYHHLVEGSDMRLFNHFSRELLSYNGSSDAAEDYFDLQGHKSRSSLAVEFGEQDMMVKAYFFPIFKARESGKSAWTITSEAIQSLPDYCPSTFLSLSSLENFLKTSPEGSRLVTEIFAIDCVRPAASRMKIYMRSRSTSFDSVRSTMTFNGMLEDPHLDQGLEKLHSLWKLVFLQGCVTTLREIDHRTAGLLYYFDLKQGRKLPGVKVYLPVRHYGADDLSVFKGLAAYLRMRQRDCFTDNYLEALRQISQPRSLEDHHGLQTYLGCSIIDGELKLTSYLAPKIYNV